MSNSTIEDRLRVLPRLPPPTAENDKQGPTIDVASGKRSSKGKAAATAGHQANGKAGDRFATLNPLVDFVMRDLDRGELAVWLTLWRDTRDGMARTSQADLARRAGVTTRTIVRSIASLECRGLLQTLDRGGRFKGISTYRLLPPAKAVQGDVGVTL